MMKVKILASLKQRVEYLLLENLKSQVKTEKQYKELSETIKEIVADIPDIHLDDETMMTNCCGVEMGDEPGVGICPDCKEGCELS